MNTLKYAKKLEAVGFSREQAEVSIGILDEVMESDLAKQQDIKDLRVDIRTLETSLRHEIHELESRLTIKLGALMVTGIAVMSALIKFF